jgi:uncharacterized membrane protein YeaQ/YmgE (transglycosylase-associated protein family)
MFSLVTWMLIGGLVGWAAGMIIRGPSLGCIGDVVVGMVGALLGGVVLSLLLPEVYPLTDFHLGSLLMALLSAVILLLLARAVVWGTRERRP